MMGLRLILTINFSVNDLRGTHSLTVSENGLRLLRGVLNPPLLDVCEDLGVVLCPSEVLTRLDGRQNLQALRFSRRLGVRR